LPHCRIVEFFHLSILPSFHHSLPPLSKTLKTNSTFSATVWFPSIQ
jgi:hypothetical protein